jgi:alanyl-tRNA synthetase
VLEEHSDLSKKVGKFQQNMLGVIAKTLEDQMEKVGDIALISSRVDLDKPGLMKDLAFQARSRYPNLCLVLGTEVEGKAHLAIMLSDSAIKNYDLNASTLIREVSKEIQGGGGGQAFFATAGGKNPAGIDAALAKAEKIVREAII